MKLDRLTQKAQEALVDAQERALRYNHSQIEPEHLLASLLEQEGGVVPQIVQKLGCSRRFS